MSKLIAWFIWGSVIFLLVWWYGTYSLFSPYFPREPYPLREYARAMCIILFFHLPVLLSTSSKTRRFRWGLLIPLLGMIGLYAVLMNKNTDFYCALGICIHLLAIHRLFSRSLVMKGVPHEDNKPDYA